MRAYVIVALFALSTLLQYTAAWAYVDPLYADSFEAFACSASDNPQPNIDIAAEPGSGGCAAGMVKVDTFCIDRYEAAFVDSGGYPVSPSFIHDNIAAQSSPCAAC